VVSATGGNPFRILPSAYETTPDKEQDIVQVQESER
jgi:hypothetical protein